jgi:lipid II:glycine glycyltransferase (peptidoglycan interpeptide bridge formation enzyme)
MMNIRKIIPNEQNHYRELALSNGSVFNDPEWIRVYGDKLTLYGIFDNDDKLMGGFYIFRSSLFGIPFYTTPPHTPSVGLFYSNPAKNSSNRLGVEKEIMATISAFFKQSRMAVQRYSLPVGITDMQPFIWDKFKVVPYFTYWIDLKNTEEELLNNISPKLRNNIRKAITDGVTVQPVTDYQVIEPILVETFRKQKIALDESRIKRILYDFANPGNSFAFVAMQEDKPVSMAFCIFDREKAFYLFGGVSEGLKHEGAGALVLWECIKHARNTGLACFDLEGSMIKGVEKFFRGFGGEQKSYFTINRAPLLLEIMLKFVKRELF